MRQEMKPGMLGAAPIRKSVRDSPTTCYKKFDFSNLDLLFNFQTRNIVLMESGISPSRYV